VLLRLAEASAFNVILLAALHEFMHLFAHELDIYFGRFQVAAWVIANSCLAMVKLCSTALGSCGMTIVRASIW